LNCLRIIGNPKILAECNDNYIKVFKAKGEFDWHKHDKADEFFLVVKGRLTIKFRDGKVVLEEGEFMVVPKGVEHCPFAEEECHVLLFEPKEVLNTGDAVSEKMVEDLKWI
jgi:mannose-6-phosphate isomerase-like protein (cupin superfamily)